jgi:hypothetical protein
MRRNLLWLSDEQWPEPPYFSGGQHFDTLRARSARVPRHRRNRTTHLLIPPLRLMKSQRSIQVLVFRCVPQRL